MANSADDQLKSSPPTLAVLAGGMGTRMGFAKANLLIRGQPILRYLHTRLCWPGPTLLVTAPHPTLPTESDIFDRHAVDQVTGQGPLRGILTALENSPGDVVAITVDMPAITLAMLTSLIDALGVRPSAAGVMIETHSGVEPFPSIYRQSARAGIERALNENRRSVRQLLSNPTFQKIPAPGDWPGSVWTNLNTLQDLARFEKSFDGEDKL